MIHNSYVLNFPLLGFNDFSVRGYSRFLITIRVRAQITALHIWTHTVKYEYRQSCRYAFVYRTITL